MNSNQVEQLLAQYKSAIMRGIGSGQAKNSAGLEQATKDEHALKTIIVKGLAEALSELPQVKPAADHATTCPECSSAY